MSEQFNMPFFDKNESDHRYYSSDQGKQLENVVANIADGTGGKSFPDIDTAMAVDPLPNDNVLFSIDESNIEQAGVYAYDSTQPGGYRWVRGFADGEVAPSNKFPVAGGKVYEKIDPFFEFAQLIVFTLAAGDFNSSGFPNTSVNWLRTEKIPCEPNTIYTAEGLGVTSPTLASRRFHFWNGATYLGVIGAELKTTLTFATPANCTHYAIMVDGGSNVGANIPGSPFWNTLKISKGYEVIKNQIRAELLVGVINTQQLQDLEDSSDLFRSFVEVKNNIVPITTVAGAISAAGAANTDPDYKRTSVTGTGSMANVDETKSYVYTGAINTSGYAGVIFKSAALATLGSACKELKSYNKEPLILPAGTKYIASCSYLTDPIIEEVETSLRTSGKNTSQKFVYVNAAYTGSESDGSETKPFKTITAAMSSVEGSAKFMIYGGDYRETIVSTFKSGDYSFIGRTGERVRILGSNKITGFTLTAGQAKTYEAAFTGTIPNGSRMGKVVFEDGNPSRAISASKRHPLQKALSYRLPFTALAEKLSIADVEANPGTFYQDVSNSKIYVHTSNSTNPNSNGFAYEVMSRGWMTPLNAKTTQIVNISMENLQFMYGVGALRFQGFSSVFRRNVTGLATTDAGAFRDDTSNVISISDEAAFCNGDGINGHFATWTGYDALTDNRSMSPLCLYIDPWCHDNFDDGMSHHENHRVIVNNPLIECNEDGGIRASNDSGYTIINPYCRENGLGSGVGEGISAVNAPINPNRNGCKVVVYGGVLEGNARGAAAITDNRNVVELIGTIVRNSVDAELYAQYGKIISRNVRATNVDPLKKKVTANGGVIEIMNDEILT